MDENFNTKRTLLFAFYFLILSVDPRVSSQIMSLRAPELFGDGQAIILQSDTAVIGLVHAPGVLFLLEGERGARDISCRLIQIAGARVTGEVINGQPTSGSEVPVLCYLYQRASTLRQAQGGALGNSPPAQREIWLGWILFRGHERAFCAVEFGESLPKICRLRP